MRIWGDVDPADEMDCGVFLLFVLLAFGGGGAGGMALAWHVLG